MSELQNLLELLGTEATLKIVEAYGGTRMAVRGNEAADCELRVLLGDAAYALLVQYFCGDVIDVPMARKWRFDIYAAMGMKRREIARKTGCTERAVYAHFNQRDEKSRQRVMDFGD